MKQKLKDYLNYYLDKNEKNNRNSIFLKKIKKDNFLIEEETISYRCSSVCNNNIDEYIKSNVNENNKFKTLLFKMIDEHELKDSDVYNKVHLDRRLFSKIRNDATYHPSKETTILLALSLELDEVSAEKLIESAAYSLPKNNYFDLIIRFCFINKIYDVIKVNELLSDYNCKLLF